MKLSAVKMAEDLKKFRTHVSSLLAPTVPVLWRLQPHVTHRDELVAAAAGNATRLASIPDHTDSARWNGVPEDQDALWPAYFNTVLRAVAAAHGDLVLDFYTLSRTYLRYFYRLNRHNSHRHHHKKDHKDAPNPTELSSPDAKMPEFRPHCDSLHYHAGGFFRSSLVMLLDALQYYDRCSSSSSNSNSNSNSAKQ
jgi:hypothetical protein